VRALAAQSERLCHTSLAGLTHEPAARLAEALVAVAPRGPAGAERLARVFFSDNGSTAVEVALKLCLQYWGQNGRPERTRFVALDGAYHGDTIGTTSLGGVELFRKPFASVVFDCLRVPSASDGYERAFAALEELVRRDADRIAAVVLEPMVQGASGMRTYAPEFLRAARRLTSEHDVFLIADEVFSGYGRTGPMWAVDHAVVVPDVLCTVKGFTAGMLPMAATLISERIFRGFFGSSERTFFYGHTFAGNPLGAALALEVLAVYADEQVLQRIPAKAARIRAVFDELGALPGVRTTRTLGMIGALEIDGQRGYLEGSGWRVYEQALARGAYLRPLGNVVYVAPPLHTPDAELDELLGILSESVRFVLRR